jgi:hypothetical protein
MRFGREGVSGRTRNRRRRGRQRPSMAASAVAGPGWRKGKELTCGASGPTCRPEREELGGFVDFQGRGGKWANGP